ncbi:MAG: putative transcriptional regulatory protein [Actinobacteria bacterium ADurb.Bin346]|nr:MAG: putative transcriptional regulatory protein [Actinobacteria bacterium ADurb.Bin346]
MSGHSKWHSIKHKKAKEDAKRGNVFGKLSKSITIAAREGGSGDPDNNFALANAITKAKEYNMPWENIERAIKRGTGEIDGEKFETIIYEGYGPGGTAMMVEAMTENRNRTAADVRNIFSKSGGNLGETGCVSWLFEHKGIIFVEKTSVKDGESFMLDIIDSGAEDIEEDDETYIINTPTGEFANIRKKLDNMKVTVKSAEITNVPKSTVEVSKKDAERVLRLISVLEEHDDIQNVYSNVEISDEILQEIG